MGDKRVIVVVDGDDESRATAETIGARVGYEVRAVATAEEALDTLGESEPALGVVAVELPGATSGLELLRELHERFGEDLPVILVSAERTTAQDRVAGFLLGAEDYLAKPIDAGELLARVRRSLRRAGATNGGASSEPTSSLSPRELEVLQLLADGKTQAQIASTLFLSPKTVSTHIQHLLAKLGVHSRAQAVAAAYKHGYVRAEVEGHGVPRDLVTLA
jgi:DNA-binding NarL/FixJ family response regulator